MQAAQAFDDVDMTEFATAWVGSAALPRPPPPPAEPWRVGESFAECFLEDRKGASFPHPYSRDQRNPLASPAGPDLAGYYTDGRETLFLLGEVKTTGDKSRPPGVAEDLRRQMEMLRPGRDRAEFLIQWLLNKEAFAGGARGMERFREALVAYAKHRLRIVGVLISDREPDQRDLDAAFARLGRGTVADERLDLVALYVPVPVGALPGLIKKGGAD